MSKILGIFHCPSVHFALVKLLGVTHVELSVNAWPGSLQGIHSAISDARYNGLNVFIDAGLFKDKDKALSFLQIADLKGNDMVYLVDEPNYHNVSPGKVMDMNIAVKRVLPNIKTFITLSSIRSLKEYANCSDIIGVDHYSKVFALDRTAKLAYRLAGLRRKHNGKIVGIPPIRWSYEEIKRQKNLWKMFGIDDLMCYSWSGDGGAWFYPPDLSRHPRFLQAIKD